jgi:hypothetical protein
VVHGDWTFGEGVSVVGEVTLDAPDGHGRIASGTVLRKDEHPGS